MAKARAKTFFEDSAIKNNATYAQYLFRLMELSVSMFEWKNLPDTVNARFLELTLFSDGHAVFFKDPELGFLTLQAALGGQLDVYRIPTQRHVFSASGYSNNLTKDDSVIIWNNYLHRNSYLDVVMFAERLYNLDRIIDVNANAQKTPVLLLADEKQRLTLLNVYQKYDGNQPVIFGSKDFDLKSVTAINTGAPYVADKIAQLKADIWNEALTYLGISNINVQKKERLITDEVARLQGGTIASRYSRLQARKEAADQINKMFDLNISVEYRDDINGLDTSTPDPETGDSTDE